VTACSFDLIEDSAFPLPPSCKSGWPWTKGSKPLPATMRNGKPWPKISIVTPSFNQGQYLEETIRSVLLQNYPNLEYIIMDGGSTDNSVEIIKKYQPWLTYWVSEKDNGQADAIYRGFEKSSGEIICWINSDDYYLPDAFFIAVKALLRHAGKNLVIGSSYHIDSKRELLYKYYGFPQKFESLLVSGMYFSQPACFFSRDAFFKIDGFDRRLRFSFDYDLFLRLTNLSSPAYTRHPLAVFRRHDASKSMTIADVAIKENREIRLRYGLHDGLKIQKKLENSHRHIQTYKYIGKMLDIVSDPKWLIRRWVAWSP